MKFEIRYYLTENAYKAGAYAFKETITADRNYVITYASQKLKYSQFKYYDIIQK